MDYEQSIKNYLILRDFISPWNCEYIYFNFYSCTEFSIETYSAASSEMMAEHLFEKHQQQLPYCRVLIESGTVDQLYYADTNIDVVYNLTMQSLEYFYIWEPVDIEKAQKEFAQLSLFMKKQ